MCVLQIRGIQRDHGMGLVSPCCEFDAAKIACMHRVAIARQISAVSSHALNADAAPAGWMECQLQCKAVVLAFSTMDLESDDVATSPCLILADSQAGSLASGQ